MPEVLSKLSVPIPPTAANHVMRFGDYIALEMISFEIVSGMLYLISNDTARAMYDFEIDSDILYLLTNEPKNPFEIGSDGILYYVME